MFEFYLRNEYWFAAAQLALAGRLAVGTVDSWLLWNLTGGNVHATDPSNASRTMLCDIRRRAWDPELCNLLHVPIDALPEIVRQAFSSWLPAILGDEDKAFWRDRKGAGINAIRTTTAIRNADLVVVRFGPKYKQWAAAFEAGYASAASIPTQ